MKKPTIIAAAVLVVLVAVALVIGSQDADGPSKLEFEIPKLAPLDKIEITNGDVKTVLAREGEKWQIKEPVDYPVSEGVNKDLDKLFADAIQMDRKMPASTSADAYELGAGAPLVALYSGGEKKVAFHVGKESTVKTTYVKRTYLKPEGSEQIYRAMGGLRSKLILDLDKIRRKKLLEFEKDDITGLTVTYGTKKVVLARTMEGEGAEAKAVWKSTEPAGEPLDSAVIDRYVAAVGKLRADGFADGTELAKAGLATPAVTTVLTRKSGEPVTLVLGGPTGPAGTGSDDKEPNYYIKLGGAAWIYTVKAFSYKNLNKTLADFRSKDMMSADSDKIEKLTVVRPGEPAPTEVAKESGLWKLKTPEEADVDQGLAKAAVSTLAKLRAERVPDVSTEDAGLADPAKAIKIVLGLAGGDTRNLFIGGEVTEGKTDRYARVGESGPIFELAGFQAEKLLKLNAKDLTATAIVPDEAPASAPAGLPPGFKLPPGMKLPPGVKLPQ